MSRVLVTGGAGFLGQYLVKNLSEAGHEVSVLDLRPPAHPVFDIRPFCSKDVAFGVDITDAEMLRGRFDGMDVVYHLAGVVSFWKKHAPLMQKVHVSGTRNVLQEARQSGVGKVIHVSSVAAIGYGDADAGPIDEEYRFDWSRAGGKHYMLSKHFAEEEVRKAVEGGLRVVTANPGLMWGPGDMLNSCKLIQGLHRRKIPACPPGGTNIVDVRDVARGLLLLEAKGRSGQRYILGGDNLTFRRVYDVIGNTLAIRSPALMLPRFAKPLLSALAALNESVRRTPPQLTADQIDSSYRCRYFSSEKASRELGWQPQYSFEDMIRDSVAWLSVHGSLS